MGLFRLYLALSIAFQHSGKNWGLGGIRAVEVFFIISGFYMSLILTTGKYRDYKTFIVNRFLRLYPIYFVVALSTLVFSFFIKIPPLPQYETYGGNFDFLALFYFIFSNLTLIAQELSLFLGIQDGHLYGTIDFRHTDPYILIFFLIPQAWSLSVELLFYAIAPALLWLEKGKRIVSLSIFILLSISCKVYLILSGFPYDPWANRFFPSVLYLFLLGALTHHVYENFLYEKFQKINKQHVFYGAFTSLMSGIIYMLGLFPTINISGVLNYVPFLSEVKDALVPYLGYSFCICLFFYMTSKNRFDRFVGELSYPIYVVHLLVLNVLGSFMTRSPSFSNWVVVISVLLSMGLVVWIQNPIERYRTQRLKEHNISKNIKKYSNIQQKEYTHVA